MNKSEIIWIASKYATKGYDYEQLCYGDELFGKPEAETLADDIWEYVEEYKEHGRVAFYEKYKEYKLYQAGVIT
jgi:hypothetical protein